MTKWIALMAFVASAASPPANLRDQADIFNSGSTNTRGYAVHLGRSGSALVDAQDGRGLRSASLPPDLVNRFFAALDAAVPFAALPLGRCMKSASFGYSVRVRYDGASTPDLACAVGDLEKTLASLTSQIARAAGVSNAMLRRPIILPPQMPSPPPQPT
jgi:hypothetical protein